MSKLVLVTPEGLIVSDKKASEVEKHQDEEPLHLVASREAAKVSTTKKHH